VHNVDEGMADCMRKAIDPDAWLKKVTIPYENGHFWRRARDLVRRDRFGEVAFAVERQDGRIITVTSTEYPEGIFRIPTGGISHGEDVLDAVHREVKEELGLEVSIERFVGVLCFRFTHGGQSFPFYSFLFHLKEVRGKLLEDATDEEVSAVMEAGPADLDRIAGNLLHIRQEWRDWGRFRHATTHELACYLKSRAKHQWSAR